MKKIVCLVMIVLFSGGCNKTNGLYTKDLLYMETFINVKIYSNNKKMVEEAFENIDNMYKEYDRLADRYNEYDNIKNVYYINNNLDMNIELEIDSKLYNLLEYSKSYLLVTNNLFNITMGNVIDVWAEYRDGLKKGVPSFDELKNGGSIDSFGLVLKDNNIIVKTSDISIDLGAIAKGYVTELVGNYLESIGLHKYIITAGTSSVKTGNHYGNDRYKIGIVNPDKTDELYKIIKGNNIAITTSGSFNKYYEYDGIRYHHIINPDTLFPTNHMLSVTVITNDAAIGEVLSTALFLMPIDDGVMFLKRFEGVEAVWYGIDGKIVKTDGMVKYE